MHIIFSHGLGGTPNDHKIQALSALAKAENHTIESVDYTDTQDPDVRARRLTKIVKQQSKPFCLVGSSMGGYASLVASEQADKTLLKGVFLMAPAIYIPRYDHQVFARNNAYTEIVHGWNDDVVLFEHSVRYARETQSVLHLLEDNHRLSENPKMLGELFTHFLQRLADHA